MITKVRHSVFETNSSSCHSVSVAQGTVDFTSITPDDDGVLRIEPQEFGWSCEDHHDPAIKLAYLMQQLLNTYAYGGDSKNQQEVVDELIKENLESTRFSNLWEVVCEHTGAISITLDVSRKSYYYIDHASVGVGVDICDDRTQIKEFIFSRSSVLHTCNDNDGCQYD